MVALLLLLAVAKPWGQAGDETDAGAVGHPPPPSMPIAAPEPSPRSPAAAVRAICYEPISWRAASIQRWRDQTIRVWQAIEPVAALGPDDPAIPLVPAIAVDVPAIGFCAPAVGREQPRGPATVTAWRRSGGATALVALRRLKPEAAPSRYGGLFAPVSAGPPGLQAGWPSGIYVFRYEDVGAGRSVWFGIEVETLAAEPGSAP